MSRIVLYNMHFLTFYWVFIKFICRIHSVYDLTARHLLSAKSASENRVLTKQLTATTGPNTISIAPRIVTGGRMKIGEASKTRRTRL